MLLALHYYGVNIEPIVTCALSKVGVTACKESGVQ